MSGVSVRIHRKQFAGNPQPTFEDFCFDVESGEIVAVVGPSGIGKSTLLSILAGLDRDFEGDSGDAQSNGIGMVFQTPRLMPWMTLTENIELVCSKDTGGERVSGVIHEVGLAGHEKKFPAQLSGGMQRRAALARAFVNRPPLLLLDEPFVSLDEPSANRLRGVLSRLWQKDRPAVIYVTHDLREAITMSDRVVFLGGHPAEIILEQAVELPRPRELQGREVAGILETMMHEYPQILSGRL